MRGHLCCSADRWVMHYQEDQEDCNGSLSVISEERRDHDSIRGTI